MKLNELLEELNKQGDLGDFEVEVGILEEDGSEWGIGLRTFKIKGIADIGHSDKKIKLDLEEK